MTSSSARSLAEVTDFSGLLLYLRDELRWPIEADDFDDAFFEYDPEELGIDERNAASISKIKQLRPLVSGQPFGVFFVEFEPRKLPVVALRRILTQLAARKRASANAAERATWAIDDLLFVSSHGESDTRQLSFAHFSQSQGEGHLPTLRVLGWDNLDTPLHVEYVADRLHSSLCWPEDESDALAWRDTWTSAFSLRNREVITTSRTLAFRLAELARAVRDRIRSVLAVETERGPVTALMNAFRQTLVHDLDEDTFADMYAQTVAYGLLSARIADPVAATNHRDRAMPVTNVFLKELMDTFLNGDSRQAVPGRCAIDFDELGIADVVKLLDSANMEAVVVDFGDRNPQEDPVIHFYELFLSEYDAEKRLQRGVFYTPRPVVSFIVRSVDQMLRTRFGLDCGLADTSTWAQVVARNPELTIPQGTSPDEPFVKVLDPATGTGTFLVEVIEVIHSTMIGKWTVAGRSESEVQELWNQYVSDDLLPRLYGYELLMAPYAIAHLKIGLKLHESGYDFRGGERVRVYLTNALEPTQDFSDRLSFAVPALAHEAHSVNEVKTSTRFTVVVGNPPYSKASQNQNAWIELLMEDYKRTVRSAETQIQALSDDYAKFIRFGHYALESSGAGVLGYITNSGYLDGPLFRDMRESLHSHFSEIRITNLHGDSRKRLTPPEGKADENVFDIQQGVAVGIYARMPYEPRPTELHYAGLWGTREERYEALARSCLVVDNDELLDPVPPHFLFIPTDLEVSSEFEGYWHPYDVFGTGNRDADNHRSYGAGFVTQQDSFAIAFTREELKMNVAQFIDSTATIQALGERFSFCSTNQWDFTRAKREIPSIDFERSVRRCIYRPFDYRYTIFDRNICTIVRKRITSQFEDPNVALLLTRRITRPPFNNVFIADTFAEYKVASHDRNTIVFPLYVSDDDCSNSESLFARERRVNFSPDFVNEVERRIGCNLVSADTEGGTLTPENTLNYIYAVLHSPTYRQRYEMLLGIDFARVPLPSSLRLFVDLAELGAALSCQHLMRPDTTMSCVGPRVGHEVFRVEKVTYADEAIWIDRLRTQGFSDVPADVWGFQIGGYQVCDKWLKDRKGRVLTEDDISHYRRILSAVYQTIRLMTRVDEVIGVYGGWPGAFCPDDNPGSASIHGS